MDTDKILTRSQINEEYTWNTKDLFKSDADFLEAVEDYSQRIHEFENFNSQPLKASHILGYYSLCEELAPYFDRIYNYAHLNLDTDTTNTLYQDYKNKVNALLTAQNSICAYFLPAIMELGDKELEAFYREEPRLLPYRTHIDDTRRLKEHTLDQSGEYILAKAGELMDIPSDIFSLFTYADLKFGTITHRGKEYELTSSTYISLMESPDRELRKLAFKTLYKTYGTFENTYAALLASQVKAMSFNAQIRGYKDSLSASLSQADVDTSVYYNLIDAVHENMDYMYRYVALRKRLLKVSELHMYDVYAPLVPESEKIITFDQAKKDVINAMSVLGQEYTEILCEGFNNRWIDIYENKGKRSGAYSCGCHVHPYVLLNHKNNLNSEFTLAHEMGHAIHSYFSNENQSPLYSDYKLFVAEVASTCNESLLMQYLLKKTDNPKERAILINYFLEQFKGTLYRQTMFAEFEMKIHEAAANGQALTNQMLKDTYRQLNELYFGKDMVIDDEITLEWARIPHFYYNFYVYQYATGFSAAIALSQKILQEGRPAVEKYINFLKAGCTKDPVSLLYDAGIDMRGRQAVSDALKLFGSLIDEMETLMK